MDDKKVVMYSTPACHFCQMTKEFLEEKGISYTDHDVSADAEKRQEMLEKSKQMSVPVIFVGDRMLIGFDKNKLSEALGIGT
jgi:glutaredoxin-like YruB-family protein|tara:strand:+ start:12202 stop:12447 length:246 start_codon:yes stop_codon:yes gene_type:complete